ncbi:MAG: DUF805 domain-containing protein, partial [Verrucomicrobiota bacterium]|nr:DUF805 domain-containing protein [Verrucomicrobiota bacterium]
MSFIEAIKSGFCNYFTFSGRASRSEYWYWILFGVLIAVIESLIGAPTIVSNITTLVLLIPGLAVSWRRLHDIDKSGAWFFISFTGLGIILLLVWASTVGTSGSNRFGSDPLGSDDPEPSSDP